MKNPEKLIDAVITDMRQNLVETKLHVLASDMSRNELAGGSAESDQSYNAAQQGIEQLGTTLKELESRRNLLIVKAQDAEARLAIERALMETDSEPAQVALDMIAERTISSEAEADAISDIRQVSTDMRGNIGE